MDGLIVGIKPAKGKGMEEPSEKKEGSGEMDMAAAKLDAAKAVRAAIESGDDQALSDALEDHRAACEGY